MKVFSKIAYHGSPAKFDKFDFAFMGTGEGAQVHGWGIYLAMNRGTSEMYRPSSSTKIAKFDGKTVPEKLLEFGISFEPLSYCDLYVSRYLDRIGSVQGMDEKIERRMNTVKMRGDNEVYEQLSKIKNVVSELENCKFEFELVRDGMLATVELPDDIVLVEEDTPIGEQSEFIQEACKKVFVNDFGDRTYLNMTTVHNLIYQMPFKSDNEKDVQSLKVSMVNYVNARKDDFLNGDGSVFEDFEIKLYDALARLNIIYENGIKQIPNDFRNIISQSKFVDNLDMYALQKTFRELYRKYYAPEASIELRDNGIDGISYDGHRDNECIVLFNLDKAKIIERDM